MNCAFYQDPALQGAPSSQEEAASGKDSDLAAYTAPNIWPSDAQLPRFKQSAEDLCRLVIETAGLVARACDRFAVQNIDDYTPGYLERVVKGSFTTKARLLHYFPSPSSPAESQEDDDDDWCATHIDHSCLTGLTSAMFVDEASSPPSLAQHKGDPLQELPRSPDPAAGLYIRSRTGDVVKVNIPKDCLAFQTGEALELITQGRFRAVPHFVKGARAAGDAKVARNTLAVFTQPNLDEEVQPGRSFGDFARDVVSRTY
jgi:isopenicillin N synthase-like dioxygenase